MLKIGNLLIAMLLASSCTTMGEDYAESDKIDIRIGKGYITDEGANLVEQPEMVDLYVMMDLEGIKKLTVNDISPGNFRCDDVIIKSPSELAVYSFSPEANIKHINFRIKLSCAAYYNNYLLQIKVDAKSGKYIRSFKIPINISVENPYGN